MQNSVADMLRTIARNPFIAKETRDRANGLLWRMEIGSLYDRVFGS